MLSLYIVSHMELSECVQYRSLEWLWVHPLAHFYSLISIIRRKVYSLRQIITPQERIPSIFSWGKKWQGSNDHNWRQSGKRGTVTHRNNNNCTEEQWNMYLYFIVRWIPLTHCSNFKGHNAPDAQLWQTYILYHEQLFLTQMILS